MSRPDHARVIESLRQVNYDGALDLFSTYAASGPDLRDWLRDADINRDRNLRLQYLAGMGVNKDLGDAIYRAIVDRRDFAKAPFTGSAGRKKELLWRALAQDPAGLGNLGANP